VLPVLRVVGPLFPQNYNSKKAALTPAHAAVDDPVADDTILRKLANTIAHLAPVTLSGDAQPDTTGDRAALNEHPDLALRVPSATETQPDAARVLLGMLIDARKISAPRP
jgi:hypothetical protein